jgi:hypothetical protein
VLAVLENLRLTPWSQLFVPLFVVCFMCGHSFIFFSFPSFCGVRTSAAGATSSRTKIAPTQGSTSVLTPGNPPLQLSGKYAFSASGLEEGGGGGDPQAAAVESLLRDRLGHFKLDKDAYNTHFYELHHDHSLAQQNLLQGSGSTGSEPKVGHTLSSFKRVGTLSLLPFDSCLPSFSPLPSHTSPTITGRSNFLDWVVSARCAACRHARHRRPLRALVVGRLWRKPLSGA